MVSINRQVANAIVNMIEGASLPIDVEVERRDVPRSRVEDLKTKPKVDVFDIGLERERVNRNQWRYTVVIHLAIQFLPVLKEGTELQIDNIDALRQSIEDLIENSGEIAVTKDLQSLRAFSQSVSTLTLTWSEKLRETGAFVSLSELRWRVL